METLWLPPSEQARNAQLARRREVEMLNVLETARFMETWNRDLKQLDPYLELVRAKDDAEDPALRPGFWHVIRRNPGAPTCQVLVVETPDGQYKDPDSSLFDELRKLDHWSERSARARERREKDLQEAKERRRQREHEERVEDATARLKTLENPGVSMTSARPWTYRTGNR